MSLAKLSGVAAARANLILPKAARHIICEL